MKIAAFFLSFGLLSAGFVCTPTAARRAVLMYKHDYAAPHRPQFHFSPQRMWMNDPNGMVYFRGEYHLFYQFHPDGLTWGPMHWGHAVSRDLVHWRHLPLALRPDSLGMIFSGSVVVDEANTSGFGQPGKVPLVAIFTQHDMPGEKAGRIDFQTQSIAYSLDEGRTWTMHAGNPVIPNPGIRDFRDPKVLWHAPSRHWVMVLAAADRVRFYRSPDLKKWEFTGEFGAKDGAHGGVWECPDLFEMPIGGTGEKRWVLLVSINPGAANGGSGTQYFIGDFDGKNFRNAAPPAQTHWLDAGRDNYAGVTWFGAPGGRRLFIGWMSNWDYAQEVPTSQWRSAMTVPRELHLRQSPAGLRVCSEPVPELAELRKNAIAIAPQTIENQWILPEKDTAALREIVLEIDLAATTASAFGIRLFNAKGEEVFIGYDTRTRQFFTDRTRAGKVAFSPKFAAGRHVTPRISEGNKLTLRLLCDVSSVELFADDGATAMTDLFFPTQNFHQAAVFAQGGRVKVTGGTYWGLGKIW